MAASGSSDVAPVPEVGAREERRVLGTLAFAAVAYFLTAGGPFGIEPAVIAAGPLPCFVVLGVLPLIWSLPQALVTAELASLIPDNGGYILWATDAFGDFAGACARTTAVLAAAARCRSHRILHHPPCLPAVVTAATHPRCLAQVGSWA